jgi:TetR/AcrR family transcriptional regulator
MRARGKQTRQQILRAAELVFAERGYAGARMDDVAVAVGIKRASMVYYFRDKRSLYIALLEDVFGTLLQLHQSVLAGPGPALERILGCLDVWADAVAERPGVVRIMMWEAARHRRASYQPLATEIGPILSTIAESIAAGQRDGSFRQAVDPLRFLMIVTGATAFLTLGMHVMTSGAEPLNATELRSELRALVVRLLTSD